MGDAIYESGYHRTPRSISTRDTNPLVLDQPSSNTGDFLFNEQTVFEEVDTPFTGIDTIVDEEQWQLPSVSYNLCFNN